MDRLSGKAFAEIEDNGREHEQGGVEKHHRKHKRLRHGPVVVNASGHHSQLDEEHNSVERWQLVKTPAQRQQRCP
jgi:hypothetical protein